MKPSPPCPMCICSFSLRKSKVLALSSLPRYVYSRHHVGQPFRSKFSTETDQMKSKTHYSCMFEGTTPLALITIARTLQTIWAILQR